MDKSLTEEDSVKSATGQGTQPGQAVCGIASVADATPGATQPGDSAPAQASPPTGAQVAGFHVPGRPDLPDPFWEMHWALMRQSCN